jgi:pimeloyl-ACP methyl ester carboxylesterase
MSERMREGFVDGAKGLRLYYRVDGTEGPWLVCSNGIGVSVFFWEPFAMAMRHRFRVVRWDWRGHGRSDSPRDPDDISVATCVDDMEALIDGLGIEQAVLVGHSMGGQVGFEYYRRHPEKVAALVPTLATAGHAVETFFDTRASLVGLSIFKNAVRAAPRLVTGALRPLLTSGVAEKLARLVHIVDPALAPHELMVPYMEHLMRMDLRTYVTLAESIQAHDASDMLHTVAVPTLVIAAEKDLFTPLRLAREMAARIPKSELLIIPNGTHAALIEQPDLLSLRVAKFLDERVFGKHPAHR